LEIPTLLFPFSPRNIVASILITSYSYCTISKSAAFEIALMKKGRNLGGEENLEELLDI